MQMQHASQQSKEGTLELTLELGIWNLWNYLKEVQSWNLELEPWTYDFTASSWGVTGDSRWHCDMIKVTPCDIFIHYFRKNYGEEQFQLAYGLQLMLRDLRLRSSCDPIWLINRYIIPAVANGAILSTSEEDHPICWRVDIVDYCPMEIVIERESRDDCTSRNFSRKESTK